MKKLPTDDYDKYAADCEKIQAKNAILLKEFEKYLAQSNLSEKIIGNHVSNIDFFINSFLLYSEAIEAKDGIDDIDSFLGDWFIRKALWSSKASIKGYAASFKKFYSFMLGKRLITEKDFDDMKYLIKDEMEEWLAALERFDNPSGGDDWF
ncbi:MAG: recombinase [Candidatus Ozemobacteraceae bacterium]